MRGEFKDILLQARTCKPFYLRAFCKMVFSPNLGVMLKILSSEY